MSDGKLALRNMWFRNMVTNEVLEITVEGSDGPVCGLVHKISELVLSSVNWEQLEGSSS